MKSIIRCVTPVSIFFFKQKTAYEMRISDWSSDVCTSDLIDKIATRRRVIIPNAQPIERTEVLDAKFPSRKPTNVLELAELSDQQIGRASCRERVGQSV